MRILYYNKSSCYMNYNYIQILNKLKMKKFLMVSVVTLTSLVMNPVLSCKALAISIAATATGSISPPTTSRTELINGDFSITVNSRNPALRLLGDGVTEITHWTFDFTNDPNLSQFPNGGTLNKALLMLTLSPRNTLITTDSTGIPGVKQLKISDSSGVPSIGTTGTITFDLLDFGFTSADILGAFNNPDTNVIPWFYQNDAIISFAKLELYAVPEPLTILGAGTAIAFGTGFKRKLAKVKKK